MITLFIKWKLSGLGFIIKKKIIGLKQRALDLELCLGILMCHKITG